MDPSARSESRKKKQSGAALAERARKIRQLLAQAIPTPRCELDFENPWQLLIATILSAQSTDRTVNRVTPELFRRWPDPAALGAADRADVEEVVKSTGFFRNKARSIQEVSRILAAEHGGEVPHDLDALVELPGVARKTANVVLGTAFGIASGIVVDTHVSRVAQRLGLSSENDPVRIEADLCALTPKRSWVDTGHRLLLHGRYVCTARAPECLRCPLNELCSGRLTAPTEPRRARVAWERGLMPREREP